MFGWIARLVAYFAALVLHFAVRCAWGRNCCIAGNSRFRVVCRWACNFRFRNLRVGWIVRFVAYSKSRSRFGFWLVVQ